MEQTVVIIKPDGVRRRLTGEILARFERAGLRIAALKLIWIKEEVAVKHYKTDKDYLTSLGNKTLKNYEQFGRDPKESLGTSDPYKLGEMVHRWLIDFITSGPVVAVLLEGQHAITKVRTITGSTMPVDAAPGTIRGDFSSDSASYGNEEKRAVENIVHASGNREEAEFERKLWFRESEIFSY